jgi:hypothetical protein
MKGSFIALNVYAYEVSCRAGTIKCSRVRLKRRALAPIRFCRRIGSPAGPAQAEPFGRQKLQSEPSICSRKIKCVWKCLMSNT